MFSRCLLFSAAALSLGYAALADEPTGFQKRSFTNAKGVKFDYRVFVPHDYNARTKPCGVILCLHGAGETRESGRPPIIWGLAPHIKKVEKKFGYLVVFPQSQDDDFWRPDHPSAHRAMHALDLCQKHYNTSSKHVYLTGVSMGGGGVWQFAAAHPDRWAAIVPICGRADPKTADKIKHIPCWAFHGLADQTIPASQTQHMVAALKKAGGHPEVTYYPDVGHDDECWDTAYDTRELWKWLATKSRP